MTQLPTLKKILGWPIQAFFWRTQSVGQLIFAIHFGREGRVELQIPRLRSR